MPGIWTQAEREAVRRKASEAGCREDCWERASIDQLWVYAVRVERGYRGTMAYGHRIPGGEYLEPRRHYHSIEMPFDLTAFASKPDVATVLTSAAWAVIDQMRPEKASEAYPWEYRPE